MAAWREKETPREKAEKYRVLNERLASLMAGERDPLPNMANMSALVYRALDGVNWAGFYLLRQGMLVLGPFQGKPACIRIPLGRGVCGSSALRRETLVVADVRTFPGHIACDEDSKSEIVVPLLDRGGLLGVLDLDSPFTERFDRTDREGLECMAARLAAGCVWRV